MAAGRGLHSTRCWKGWKGWKVYKFLWGSQGMLRIPPREKASTPLCPLYPSCGHKKAPLGLNLVGLVVTGSLDTGSLDTVVFFNLCAKDFGVVGFQACH